MMKLFRPGGAISVFLIIILVPCLVLCFLYVDLSRIELSKSSVESTADTTLNSLMANYDTVLSDYYGLVASVQNIDDFCDKSKEFFKKTLEAMVYQIAKVTRLCHGYFHKYRVAEITVICCKGSWYQELKICML